MKILTKYLLTKSYFFVTLSKTFVLIEQRIEQRINIDYLLGSMLKGTYYTDNPSVTEYSRLKQVTHSV